MPNLILTSNAKFRPFEYSEMLAPVLMATQAHQAIEEAYSELDSQANAIGSLANEINDPVTYARYKSYEASLRNQADILAKNGLTPGSRKSLLDLKGRYAKEITPIQNAITRRRELADEQRKAILKDPSMMFDIDYSKTQLDYLLDNPNATYTPISGNELTKRAAQMAGNLAKVLQGNPKYQSILGGQYFQQMQQMGYTPAQIMQAILNDENAPAELRQIAETVFNEAGLGKYSSDIQEKARGYINSGLYEAIGTARYDAMNNRGYISPAEQRRLDMEKERLDMQKEQQKWAKEKFDEERLGIELPNGDRIKDIEGGRVRVIHPDGTFEIKAAPSTSGVSKSTAEKQATFTTLEYTGGSFDSPGWSDKFSESDAKLITFNELSPKARKKLQEDLAKYGLSVADVDIYEDQDYFSKNHYRVTRKGTGVAGVDVSTTEQQQNEGL